MTGGSTLDFSGGTHNFNGTVNLDGNGTYEVIGGTLNIPFLSTLKLLAGTTLLLSSDAIGGSGNIDSFSSLIVEGVNTFSGSLTSNNP